MYLNIALVSDQEIVWEGSIAHNLSSMANYAGLYWALWRPLTQGYVVANDVIHELETGLAYLEGYPGYFKSLNPENGWGTYEMLVGFTESYLGACRQYPDAVIEVR